MIRSGNLVINLAAAIGLAMACSSCRRADPTQLVVGIQSDPLGDAVTALHVVTKVGGKVVTDERISPPAGSKTGLPLPWEKALPAGGNAGAPIDVEIEGFGAAGEHAPLLTRRASTHFVPGRVALLRVQLEPRCIVYPPPPPGAKVPGPLSGPTCTAPATCIRGICQSGVVAAARLEPYAPNWPNNAPDRCKPVNGGPPVLQLGTGQSYYLPLTPGQTLRAEAGPQGGHHVWIAVRMKNMKQLGSTTRIAGVQPTTGAVAPPSTFAFPYDPDEGGFCKLAGLRYQFDTNGVDYTQFLGKPLDLTITVTDPAGATQTATAHVQIAPTLINP